MKGILIMIAMLVFAGIACNSTANGENGVRTEPISRDQWPQEPNLSEQEQNNIVNNAPKAIGPVQPTLNDYNVVMPPGVKNEGIIFDISCQEGQTCVDPPLMLLSRTIDGVTVYAHVDSNGRLLDLGGNFRDVQISKK